MITGKTKPVALLGWPVEHSFSPAMQNAAFRYLGLDYVYLPLAVKPDDLGAAIAGLKAMGFAGANVTIPHKVAVMAHLDALDDTARMVGAVNTIVIEDGRTAGHNTDAAAFIAALAAAGVKPNGKRVVLLGAGGAARAVAAGLIHNNAAWVTVVARNEDKAAALAASFAADYKTISSSPWLAGELSRHLADCDIIINCTPVGMWPNSHEMPDIEWKKLNPRAVVCDLIYNPNETRFLHEAARRGHQTVGGVGMLVEQGALAFTLWTGREAPREVMAGSLKQRLHELTVL
ncbi:shikimate dehydrogenase [Sporolituus thermophilus]|uniref:Shikimate dehydrogenase (NADP(+)) n=1 Tax=Sporolituus thermophilus DSM 23256 TaxID=1123285 RepID=A0A1G7I9I7_9FIRM|nr:shikimate dehydrogenase [Sporolituus thermophilus]SDF09134.1 shikimate dehydrogenase [Sporolituus thermophilus DSM 23256]